MLETIAKNLWLLLTLIVPGLFTYGSWRLLLLLEPGNRLDTTLLDQIDSSATVTISIIIAIALLQQAIAIVIESGWAKLAKHRHDKWPVAHALFNRRFEYAAAGKLSEAGARIIGNFFLSLNIVVGVVLLLVYFLFYESMTIGEWVPVSLTALFLATLITIVFRFKNASLALKVCIKDVEASPAEEIKNARLGLVARLIARRNIYSD